MHRKDLIYKPFNRGSYEVFHKGTKVGIVAVHRDEPGVWWAYPHAGCAIAGTYKTRREAGEALAP